MPSSFETSELFRGEESSSQIVLHIGQELSRDSSRFIDASPPVRVENLLLVVDAFQHGLEYSLTISRSPDEVQRIQRDHQPFQRLLKVSIAREFPDAFSEGEMRVEE